MDEINKKIQNDVCQDIIDQLSDLSLLDDYKQSKSVKQRSQTLETILEKHRIEKFKKDLILKDYIMDLVPSGTKGAIRGNKFNLIVKNIILGLKLDRQIFDIEFEKICPTCQTAEIPDWYIYNKLTTKTIIGMNQLDLWTGGHQLNRGYKYLMSNIKSPTTKIVCVVCNKIQFKTITKTYKMFEVGFREDTLCYPKNIATIISKYFDLE